MGGLAVACFSAAGMMGAITASAWIDVGDTVRYVPALESDTYWDKAITEMYYYRAGYYLIGTSVCLLQCTCT